MNLKDNLRKMEDKSMINEGKREITCHAELVSASHDTEIPKQVRNDMNPSPQPSPTRGEGVNSRVDFSLPLITGLPRSLRSLAMTKNAFTLAEVLITLGIIGIVAAMTMPSLIQKYQEQVTVTKVKKFYSEFSQAYSMAIMENGTLDNWGLKASVLTEDEDGNSIHTDQSLGQYDKFFGIIEKYLKNIKKNKFTNTLNDSKNGFYVLPDGMLITGMWLQDPERCNSAQNPDFYCGDFYVSTKYGKTSSRKNIFCFKISPNRIEPYGAGESVFRDYCLSGRNYSRCSAWVIMNGNMDYLHCDDLSWSGKHKCSK